MANNVIDWAYKFTLPHHLEKFVLVTLADDATKAGTCYYIGSMRNLARLCSVSERQARRVIRRLEKYGLVITSPQERPNGSATVNVYQLRITIDPEGWAAPAGIKAGKRHAITAPADQEGYYVNFDEAAFFAALRAEMNSQAFTTWIGPTRVVRVERRGRLILRVPNPYFVDFLQGQGAENGYSALLLKAAQQVQPKISKVHLIVDRKDDAAGYAAG